MTKENDLEGPQDQGGKHGGPERHAEDGAQARPGRSKARRRIAEKASVMGQYPLGGITQPRSS